MRKLIILVLFVAAPLSTFAGEADIVGVEVSCNSNSLCRFDVSVQIPADLTEVVIRAHDFVHGHGGKEFRVKLPAAE